MQLADLRIFTEPQQGATYDTLLAVAQRAEALRFGAFFRSDHYLAMGDSDGLPGPTDAWITLAGLARDTSTIRLGTLVSPVTFRSPGLTAISVAQVDQMSGGRVELGLGAGWYAAEHMAYSFGFPPMAERFDSLTDQLAIIEGLWSTPIGERFNYAGSTHSVVDSPALPKPVQDPLPIVIGGGGKVKTPRLAARHAAEFNMPFVPLDVFQRQCARVREACAAIGRTRPLVYSAALVVCVGSDEAEVARRAASIGRDPAELRQNGAAGTPEEVAETLRRWRDGGAERMYLQVLDLDDLDHLDLIASEVAPLLKLTRVRGKTGAMSELDLVIRGGTIVDGTGAAPRRADVAVKDGRIVAVDDRITDGASRTIDADGLTVTPGFVDIHTHYDGQATWDPVLAPSSIHGVTSLVMGNCGVGFAPAKPTPDQHDWLIGLLEGVEDIPGTALAEGLTWDWETFPQYMDALGRREFALDVGTQVAHAPLRVYVMGERGASPDETPTADELAEMAAHVRDGIRAGALGFTTSRTYIHRTRDGAPLGTRFSTSDELLALASALTDVGSGVIQLISDAYQSPDTEYATAEMMLMRSLVEATGRPLSMTVQQPEPLPDRWREMATWVDGCVAAGLPMKTQMSARPIGVLQGLTATLNPLVTCQSFQEVARLPLPQLVAALRDPERRARIIVEHDASHARLEGMIAELVGGFHKLFPMEDPVDYEPAAADSVAGRAAAAGVRPIECVIDLLCERDGNQLLYMPLFNYAAGNLDAVREMMLAPNTLLGLSDAGAHCGAISDGSMTTTALALWCRDRQRGTLPIELMVHHLTQRTAAHVGWHDRGVLAPGYLADINVIDMGSLAAHPPTIVHDLPAGGRRLMQTASGYQHTFKTGVETFANGVYTGALPGSLVRGEQRR